MDKKQMQDKLAAIREAKSKNSFSQQKENGAGNKKATGTSARRSNVTGNRKVGSGD